MHYSNLVVIPHPRPDSHESLESLVEQVMGPNEEQGGFWDWFQIGGRWSGALDGYDPSQDPENQEPCHLCKGTGKYRGNNECSACKGSKTQPKWPTQWAFHTGDVMPIAELTEEQLKKFYRVVLPNGYGAFSKQSFKYIPWKEGNDRYGMEENEMPPLDWLKKEFAGHICVVVDNHS